MNIFRHIEAAEPIFFCASQTIAVSLAIAVVAMAMLRALPTPRPDEAPDADGGIYAFNDGAPPGEIAYMVALGARRRTQRR